MPRKSNSFASRFPARAKCDFVNSVLSQSNGGCVEEFSVHWYAIKPTFFLLLFISHVMYMYGFAFGSSHSAVFEDDLPATSPSTG